MAVRADDVEVGLCESHAASLKLAERHAMMRVEAEAPGLSEVGDRIPSGCLATPSTRSLDGLGESGASVLVMSDGIQFEICSETTPT